MKRVIFIIPAAITICFVFNGCTKPDESVCNVDGFYQKYTTINSTLTLAQLNTLFGQTGDKFSTSEIGYTGVSYKWYPCPGKPKFVLATFRNNLLYSVSTNFTNTICSGFVNDVTFGRLSLGANFTTVKNIFSTEGERNNIVFSGGKTSAYYYFHDCYDPGRNILVIFQDGIVTSFTKNF